MFALGFLGNLGGLVFSTLNIRAVNGIRLLKPEAVGAASGVQQSEYSDDRLVLPSQGNEVRRNGLRGVGVPHSTDEAGEFCPGDPVEGREHHGI